MTRHDSIMHAREQQLKRLCTLYLQLSRRGYPQSVLKLPRTLNLQDVDYVWEIIFNEDDHDMIEIEVGIHPSVSSLEEVQQYLDRAEQFLTATLANYTSPIVEDIYHA